MQKIRIMLWLTKKFHRRSRIVIAGISVLLIIAAVLIILPALSPRFIMTVGESFSFKTPAGFTVGSMYDFEQAGENSSQFAAATEEGNIPYIYSRDISFRYPEVIDLNNPAFTTDTLLQSMNFKIGNLPGDGLIQIWNLTGSFDDFQNGSTNNGEVTYQAFKSSGSNAGGLKCASWDYTFESGGMDVHGLETFFAIDNFLYRVSLYVPENSYDSGIKKVYDDLIESVK